MKKSASSPTLRLAIALALMSTPSAHAQIAPAAVTAPVSAQILSAKRAFISNAGGDSYGAESYFKLTKYDGGPDRFYNQFYSAMKSWGKYELADAPATADIVFEVRFTSPIVDKQVPTELVYDPQLNVAILDPKTRITLWTMTEHIQPADDDAAANNRNFDQAVDRMMNRARKLVGEAPMATINGSASMSGVIPVGAQEVAERQAQVQRTMVGLVVGSAAGVLAGLNLGLEDCAPISTCTRPPGTPAFGTFMLSLGTGMLAGGLIGWFWGTQ